MRTMKQIFRANADFDAQNRHVGGTDKESNHAYGDAYGDAYENLFPDRAKIKLVLEVGNADGSSLMAWRECFPEALIVGMDIHVAQRAVGQERIEFHIGDQRSKEDCDRVAQGRQFDLIVEDAVHSLENTLLTLFYLWPHVAPGGVYVVEEWANVGGCKDNIMALWPDCDPYEGTPQVEIVNTIGPFGGVEPLVVFRKPL